MWGDSTDADIVSSADNQLLARASGGVTFYTNSGLTSGVTVGAGGNAWNTVSDRNLKENSRPWTAAPCSTAWRRPGDHLELQEPGPTIRHMGPVAQDFYAAFGVGEDDTHISTIDADGVALAAIQGLYQVVQEQASQIAALQAENAALEARLAALEARAAGTSTPFAGRWGVLGLAAAGLALGVVLTRRGGGR